MRGFGGMGGLGNMADVMKKAQKAMAEMQKVEGELAQIKVEGSAGGGMVKAEVTGAGTLEAVQIDPQVVDPEDVEMLQDLVITAVRDAMEKAAKVKEEKLRNVTGGFGLPPGIF